MKARPRTKASRKRRQRIKDERRQRYKTNLGIPPKARFHPPRRKSKPNDAVPSKV